MGSFVSYILLKLRNAVILFLSLLFFTTSANAIDTTRVHQKHPRQYSIMDWTKNDGLASNFISDIIQTRDGFLWVATDGGLSRFDGVSFTNINRKSHPILLSNNITSLLEDQEGNIWFGTHGGGMYTIKPDTMLRITDEMGLPSNYVLSLAEDSSGTIWVGTDGEGLGKVLPDTVLKYSEEEGLSRYIYSLIVDKNKTLWIGSQDGIFKLIDGAFQPFQFNEKLPSRQVFSLYLADDDLYVATPSGLAIIKDDEIELLNRFDQPIYVSSATKDQNDDIWISTLGNGLYKVTTDTAMQYFPKDQLSAVDVNHVFTDREENIWVGTRELGLLRLRDEIITTYTTEDGLPDDLIYSVTEGRPGEIWLGTPEGITKFANSDVKTFVPGSTSHERMFFTVQANESGAVWGGTRSGQLYELKNNQLIEKEIPTVPGVVVISTFIASDGTIWTGTNYGLYRIRGDEIKRFSTIDKELTNNDIRSITEDNNGIIWVGTSFGLNAYSNGKFTHYTDDYPFSNLLIVALHTDDHGDVWAGTYGGLHRLRDDKITAITQGNGLPNDRISTILEDDFGFLWIGTSEGIVRINKSELNDFMDGKTSDLIFDNFGRSEGMKNELVTNSLQPTGWKAHDGTLWFATSAGVATLNPAEVERNMVPPSVHIISTKIDRAEALLPRSLQTLELPRKHNEVELSYTAPTFIDPSKVTFRYKLEGLHTDWIEAGTRRNAYFSRIPPGEYTFRIIAANEDGVWNEAGASLPVIVHPPFWMTSWFIFIVVVFFLSSGPMIYYRRVTNLKKEQNQQQKFTKRLLESQEAERHRIAAELHDGLGQNLIIIKNRAMMGMKENSKAEIIARQLEEISQTASMTLEEIRIISHDLRPFNLERFGLTQSIKSAVRNANESSNINFIEKADNIDGLIKPELEIHVYRIIQESINNILKHSKAKQVWVNIKKQSDSIRLSLSDDGKGFDLVKDLQNNGFGLADIEQRAGLIGGKLSINSKPDKGTAVELIIPIKESYHD